MFTLVAQQAQAMCRKPRNFSKECDFATVWNVKGKCLSFVFEPGLRQWPERYATVVTIDL